MIFPILKKIGYFFFALDFACIDVMLIYKIIENYCKYSSYTILNWEGCGYIAMLILFAFCAYDFFSKFRKYNLKENIKCSKGEFWNEIKTIVKMVVFFLLAFLLLYFVLSFVATAVWIVKSFPDFLLHYIEYGPSRDLYLEFTRLGGVYGGKYSVEFLLEAIVFTVLCLSGAICLLQCFLIKKMLLENRDKKLANAIEMLSKKLDEINYKVDSFNEISCKSLKEKE